MRYAYLISANLSNANLSNANLRGVSLYGANLTFCSTQKAGGVNHANLPLWCDADMLACRFACAMIVLYI